MVLDLTKPVFGHGWFLCELDRVITLCAQNEVSDAEYAQYLELIENVLDDSARTGSRRGILFDVSKGGSTNAARRKKLTELLTTRRADITRAFLACAFASGSPVARGIATAIMWMAPPPIPTKFVATPAEAIEWLQTYVSGVHPQTTLARYEALKRNCLK